MSMINKYDEDMNVVAKQLKYYRNKNKLSYEKLSAKLELMGIIIHKQSLYDIENNKRTVKDFELYGIANALNIAVEDLLIDMKNKMSS